MRVYIKSSAFLLSMLLLECLLAPLVKAEERSNGDIVIIGDTSDKQLEMENYWAGYGKKRTVSNPQSDEDIARFCRREQLNPYSAYDKYSECVTVESKAKNLLLSTGIENKANGSARTSCFYRSTGRNQTEPTAWSYRYSCIKNDIERQIRKQQYMN